MNKPLMSIGYHPLIPEPTLGVCLTAYPYKVGHAYLFYPSRSGRSRLLWQNFRLESKSDKVEYWILLDTLDSIEHKSVPHLERPNLGLARYACLST